MRYLLNSAVIATPGTYRYQLITVEEARRWLAAGGWVSRIGYAATARYVRWLWGLEVPLSRAPSRMAPGDEVLVVRLKYRLEDSRLKQAQWEPTPEDWEIGLLTRVE
jgi:hypothetical protein